MNWQKGKDEEKYEKVFTDRLSRFVEGQQKRIMIVGVKQKQVDSEKVWDYSACLYPEGILNPDKLFLFDSEQIERLYFIGFQDGEGLAFLEQLNKMNN